MNGDIVVVSREELERVVADAVARGIDRMRPLLLKAAVEYASEDEVEVRFGLPHKLLAAWRKDGRGPAFYQVDGRRPLYRISDVDEYLTRHRVEPDGLC